MTAAEQKLASDLVRYIMTSTPVWPALSSAAATGNSGQENLFRPVTAGAKDHGSDGLWQWRLDRLTGPNGLQPWCARMGYAWNLMESQVLFMKYEMKMFYTELYNEMINPGSRSLENLTANFMNVYERPNPELAALDKRIEYARAALTMLPAAPAPSVGVTIPTPGPDIVLPAPAIVQPAPAAPSQGATIALYLSALKISQDKYKAAQKAVAAATAALAAAKQQLVTDMQAVTSATQDIQAQVDQATKEMTQ